MCVFLPVVSKVWCKLQLLQSRYSVCVHLVLFHSYQSKNTAMMTKKRFSLVNLGTFCGRHAILASKDMARSGVKFHEIGDRPVVSIV